MVLRAEFLGGFDLASIPNRIELRPKAKVLIVSDEPVTARVWGFSLNQVGFETRLIGITEPVMDVWAEELPDLIIIEDFNAEVEELALCQELRGETVVPILYLTTKTDEAFLLEIYHLGVDECISFPISPRLFQAKVSAWLRRTSSMPLEVLEEIRVGGFHLNMASRRLVTACGEALRLTVLEARLLYLLMSQPGRIFETEQIVEKVWGYYGNGDSRLLKNVVYRLRRKLEPDPAQPQYLVTEGTSGYRFLPVAG